MQCAYVVCVTITTKKKPIFFNKEKTGPVGRNAGRKIKGNIIKVYFTFKNF